MWWPSRCKAETWSERIEPRYCTDISQRVWAQVQAVLRPLEKQFFFEFFFALKEPNSSKIEKSVRVSAEAPTACGGMTLWSLSGGTISAAVEWQLLVLLGDLRVIVSAVQGCKQPWQQPPEARGHMKRTKALKGAPTAMCSEGEGDPYGKGRSRLGSGAYPRFSCWTANVSPITLLSRLTPTAETFCNEARSDGAQPPLFWAVHLPICSNPMSSACLPWSKYHLISRFPECTGARWLMDFVMELDWRPVCRVNRDTGEQIAIKVVDLDDM